MAGFENSAAVEGFADGAGQAAVSMDGLFSAAKIAQLKNTASLLTANVAYGMCAFRARMQQSSKLTLCSTVAL
ncbi:hypothetical protein GWP40_04570 [Treponema vincentii]|nr:hypothetical protein [Treponema vincentii]QUY17705.1 hypothetical protein GWP40_04570 [Treponema vincentii]